MIDIEQKLNQYYIRICDEYCDLAVCWLRTIRSENENLTTSRSRHHFYELQYVLDGGLSFRLSDQDMRINAGEFVLVPPDCYHEITGSEENSDKGDDYTLTDADKDDIANIVLANFTDVAEVGL